MSPNQKNRRADYDENGDIILRPHEDTSALPDGPMLTPVPAPVLRKTKPIGEEIITWNILEEGTDDARVIDETISHERLADVRKLMSGMTAFTRSAAEGSAIEARTSELLIAGW